MLIRILIGLAVMSGFMNISSASDVLDPAANAQVEFTVSDRLGAKDVSASVTLAADGLQRLPSDGQLSVNGIVINARRLQKQGYWYEGRAPRAARYDLGIRRGKGLPETAFTLHPRRFVPEMPKSFARSSDLLIRFEGQPPGKSERLFIELASVESVSWPQNWRFVLKGVVEGERIRIPAKMLAGAVVGEAVLNVGLICPQTPAGSDDELTYAVGAEARVFITE